MYITKLIKNEQIKSVKIENDMLNVMIKKPLVENNICRKCKIYKLRSET